MLYITGHLQEALSFPDSGYLQVKHTSESSLLWFNHEMMQICSFVDNP